MIAPLDSMNTSPTGVFQAAVDLGMGQDLQQQVQDQLMQRRKLALLSANQQPSAFGALALGPNVTGTGNTGGMALQALMGTGALGG